MWLFYYVLSLFTVFQLIYGRDLTKCPGPLAYYEALGCAPIYDSVTDNCATRYDCSHLKEREVDNSLNDEDVCHFGNITMKLADELTQITDYSSVCVICVCEVPPLPTCQRLPNDECDVTK